MGMFFLQAEDGIRDVAVTGVQTCALPICEHVRLPRTYRGRDVLWWMDRSGVWDQQHHEIDDLARARRLPSPQLVGTPERTTRSEERRVGKECRSGCQRQQGKNQGPLLGSI